MNTSGIDGCRAGWLAVSLDRDKATHQLLRSAAELTEHFDSRECVFIDIPIGLGEDQPVRMCDFLLRRVLGPGYSSSVFSPPVRAAFLTNDYKAACDINEAKTGQRFSKQAWNIMPKIRQIDDILLETPALIDVVHESHPELLFKKLNRGGAPLPRKKTAEGIQQRYSLLTSADNRVEQLYEQMRQAYTKTQAKDDDLLDALILALMAAQTPHRPIRTLPLPPELDAKNLPMAIHFV